MMNEMRKLMETLDYIAELGDDNPPVDGDTFDAGGVRVTIWDTEVALNNGHGQNIWLRRNEWDDFVKSIRSLSFTKVGEGLAEEQLDEGAGSPLYVGFMDEKHVGLHPLPRFESTTDEEWARKQALEIASDEYEDVVVLKFSSGREGFSEYFRAAAGRDSEAEHKARKQERGLDEAVPQRQDSTKDQLIDLIPVAEQNGMYDAADYLKLVLKTNFKPVKDVQ